MRQIKYRARRKDNGKWAYGLPYYSYGSNDWMITRSNGWQPSYSNPDEGEGTEYISVDPETIVQFTGLKDKNGDDIYEGDIIGQGDDIVGIMIFKEGGFRVDSGSTTQEPDILVQYRAKRLFVIGNAHENPELLTK